MIRSIGIVLVIWGLIVQPLLAAAPLLLSGNSSYSLVASDTGVMAHAVGHRSDQNVEEPSKILCHENATDIASSESCDNCDNDCMNGMCASSCVMSRVAAIQELSVNLDLLNSTSVAAFSGARAHGLPSRIFHPPRQS